MQELSDLLEEVSSTTSPLHRSALYSHSCFQYVEQDIRPTDQVNPPEGSHDGADIEADILAELDSLRPKQASTTASAQKLSLVTLDIPCVSFVRFPSNPAPTTTLDPVEIVRQICASASHKDSPGPRSRYIKRLTPVSLVRKTLSDGLENLCEQILPPHFLIKPDLATTEPRPEVDGEPSSPSRTFKFAIRPTIRNNNKIDRDHVIRVVADKITALGQGKHTVDLKGYEKLVLVDVYRNIVGMSVVGNEYESLKRFNLAEIHASHFADDKEEKTGGGESGP